MYDISDKVIKLIMEAIKNWKVELTVGEKTIAEVKIQRSIFQGDAILPILFVIAMMPLTYILGVLGLQIIIIKSRLMLLCT